MALFEDLPFERGQTFFGTGTPAIGVVGTTDRNLEGKEYFHVDKVLTNGVWVPRTQATGQVSQRMVKVRVVRGSANTGVLLPANLGLFETSTSIDTYKQYVKGLTSAANQVCCAIDEFLPAAGITKSDLFFIVLRGPANILTDGSSTAIAVDDGISSSGTAGLCVKGSYAGATTVLAGQIATTIGRALAANSNTSSTNVIVDVGGYIGGGQ